MAAFGIDLFVQRAQHADQRRLEYVGRVADRVSNRLVARGHAIEGAMRLDVVERHALGLEKALERADLIDQAIRHFLAADLHLAATETLQIRQGGMRANRDAMRLGEPHRRPHVIEVRSVKSAGDIGDVDEGHQAGVVAHFVEPERLAHVAIDRGHKDPRRLC